jgi:hypothetical protein
MTLRQRASLSWAIGIAAVLCTAGPASAYVGPGAGLTLVGALWGLIAAVVLSIGFVILWPFRRLLRRHRRPAMDDDRTLPDQPADR